MNKKTVHVVPHSHWDREWYFTIEDSNVLLAENLDFLLDILEHNADFPAYVFDGQVSVIDEYLKVRPDYRERVCALIAARRLIIGPWYTQTDTLLPDIECVIRNLAYGTRGAVAYGNCMNIGYLPDVFGQNSYLPSIFVNCNLEYALFQRGIATEKLRRGLNFYWQSPDGISIKTNNLFFGYGPGKFVTSDSEHLNEKLLPILNRLAAFDNNQPHILLPSGGDQMLVRPELPAVVRALNKNCDDYHFELSDYENFMRQSWKNSSDCGTIHGEMLACEKSRVHRTIASQRTDIKINNAALENKLIRQLEPLAVIGSRLGLRYPKTQLDTIWKELFDVHSHDSIGGCNSDTTNAAILARLRRLDDSISCLQNIIKKQICRAIAAANAQQNILTIFNTTINSECQHNVVVFSKSQNFALQDFSANNIVFSINKSELISGGSVVNATAGGEKIITLPGYYRSEITILDNIQGPGYNSYIVTENNTPIIQPQLTCAEIANANYRIRWENQRLILQNCDSGKIINDPIIFEDCADAGDSYDFSPLPGDTAQQQSHCALLRCVHNSYAQSITVRHELIIPANLNERLDNKRTAKLTIDTTIELRATEKFMRISHYCHNNVCDHRLRVLLPAIECESSFAGQGYSLIGRTAYEPDYADWRANNHAEAPVAIYPFSSIAGCCDAQSVAAIFTDQLKEYQLLPEQQRLAVTLFRSIGLLGRDDLAWRPGRASGINNKVVTTPDAQLLKPLTLEYGYYNDRYCSPATLYKMRDSYRYQAQYYQTQTLNSFNERLDRFLLPQPLKQAPPNFLLLNVQSDNICLSALKAGFESDTIIIRLYNPTAENQPLQLTTDYEIQACNLIEQQHTTFDGEIPARGYLTLSLRGINS